MKTACKGPAKEEDPAVESGKVRGAERPDKNNVAEAKGRGSVKEREQPESPSEARGPWDDNGFSRTGPWRVAGHPLWGSIFSRVLIPRSIWIRGSHAVSYKLEQ